MHLYIIGLLIVFFLCIIGRKPPFIAIFLAIVWPVFLVALIFLSIGAILALMIKIEKKEKPRYH